MAVREAILSVTGGSLSIFVVVVVIAMLVRKAMIMVVERVRVMRFAVLVLVLVLVGAMAERFMLDTMLVRAEVIVKRHVNSWQDLEAGEPKQARKHGADTGQSHSSTAIHCSGTVATLRWPINHRFGSRALATWSGRPRGNRCPRAQSIQNIAMRSHLV